MSSPYAVHGARCCNVNVIGQVRPRDGGEKVINMINKFKGGTHENQD